MKFVVVLTALIAAVYASPVAIKAPSWRDFGLGEFDNLLKATMIQHFTQLEDELLKITEQMRDLKETKNRELKAQILKEITKLDRTIANNFEKKLAERELTRTDLNVFEKINFETALYLGVMVSKNLNALTAQVNGMAVL